MLGNFFLALLYAVCIADPSGLALGLKYLAFAAFVLAALLELRHRAADFPAQNHILVVAFFAVIVPAYGILIFFAHTGGLALNGDMAYLTAGLFMSHSLLLASQQRVNFALEALDAVLRVCAVYVLLAPVVELLNMRLPGMNALLASGNAVVTTRNYGGCLLPYVYVVSAPLLVFGLARNWFRFFESRSISPLCWALIFSAALMVSGTRAALFMGAVGPLLLWAWYKRGFFAAGGALVLIVMCVMFFVRTNAADPSIQATAPVAPTSRTAELSLDCMSVGKNPLYAMLGRNEYSNSVKLAYLPYYREFFADPQTLIFGQGFNARSWSSAVREMLPKGSHITELSYLELLRIFGLPMATIIALALAWPLLQWRRFEPSQAYCPAGWALYLVLAASNPFIFSSNGMMIFAVVLAAFFSSNRNPQPVVTM